MTEDTLVPPDEAAVSRGLTFTLTPAVIILLLAVIPPVIVASTYVYSVAARVANMERRVDGIDQRFASHDTRLETLERANLLRCAVAQRDTVGVRPLPGC